MAHEGPAWSSLTVSLTPYSVSYLRSSHSSHAGLSAWFWICQASSHRRIFMLALPYVWNPLCPGGHEARCFPAFRSLLRYSLFTEVSDHIRTSFPTWPPSPPSLFSFLCFPFSILLLPSSIEWHYLFALLLVSLHERTHFMKTGTLCILLTAVFPDMQQVLSKHLIQSEGIATWEKWLIIIG